MKNLKRSFAAVCEAERPATLSIPDLLRRGLAHHQAGRVPEAAADYRRVLDANPNVPDALHLLGVATLQLGDAPRAVEMLERAVGAMPGQDAPLSNLGNARLATGDIAGALEAYDTATRLNPANPETQYNAANALAQSGRTDEAIERYRLALQFLPTHLGARFNLANALSATERHEEALPFYRNLAIDAPELPGLASALGACFSQTGHHDDAETTLRAAIDRSPKDGVSHANLGAHLDRQTRFDEAIACFRKVVELAPLDLGAHLNLARGLMRSKSDEAIDVAVEAVRLDATSVEAWRTLGDARLRFGQTERAMEAYDRVRGLDPDGLRDTNNLGLALFRNGRLEETIDFYEGVLPHRPEDADAWGDLGIARLNGGDVPGSIRDLRHSLALNPSNEYAHSNLLLGLCYSDDHTGDDLLAEAKAWADAFAPEGGELPPVHVGGREKLRIGYLSADFHAHPAGYLYEALFPGHDRSRFEIVAYSNKAFRDDVTRRIESSVDRWSVVDEEGNDALAARIREDGIDILVDLLGHTPDHRLKAFAKRPAPVQATWLGYFGTTGMAQMDYLLADRFVLPDRHEAHYTERPARMAGCLYVFQPPKLPIGVSPLPALAKGHVTFGCFNNLAKITPAVVELWAEVLRELPSSRIVLNRWPFESARVRRHYLNLFAAHGIDPERVQLRATKGREAYFRGYHDVDVMLDSFPFGGGTTTMESLWMGVPVVTLSTERFVGRMTESILHAVGRPEMVPTDRAAFVRMALDLAGDLPRLATLRASLREEVETSPLCDLPAYTRDLEATFEWMWANRR